MQPMKTINSVRMANLCFRIYTIAMKFFTPSEWNEDIKFFTALWNWILFPTVSDQGVWHC